MSLNLPEKLYRYRQLSANTIESLCSDQLFFSAPSSFNDPLDCRPLVESDSDKLTLQKIVEALITRRVEKETNSSLYKAKMDDEDAIEHSRKVAQQDAHNELHNIAYLATDPEWGCSKETAECHILTNRIQDELIRRYEHGVCCFSSDFSNPVLWSHYGDQHRGICIGYSADRLTQEHLDKVEYGGSRKITTSLIAEAILNNNEEALKTLDRNTLFRKAPSWEYEEEWRMVGKRGLHNSSLILKDITFGLRCSNEFKYLIYKAFERRKDVELYEIREKCGTFDLDRITLQTGELSVRYPANNRFVLEVFAKIKSLDDESAN